MFLKELTKNRFITIHYHKDGILQTCKGLVYNLDLYEQALLLKDESQKVCSIRLSEIKEIH
ncbi:YolD-like family protein [Bacillus taeanensis]|uniref:YolD-like family protein n=1 Tax=Bacillus taeanensis TaxID=273032 RepID=A0A366XWJ4_9BACI|nr:YolD-like family protein [Bacillus taeanensis]RBW68513.1 hypothetical protein DS031_16195 [Bacillus taeanensis]